MELCANNYETRMHFLMKEQVLWNIIQKYHPPFQLFR